MASSMSSSSSSTSSSSSSFSELLESADPRVHWALRALDNEGVEPTTFFGYYYPLATGFGLGALIMPIVNAITRKPYYANLPLGLFYAGVGTWLGVKMREMTAVKNAKTLAYTRHYIITHPDKFVQQERVKFGDRVVFLDWARGRGV